MVCIIVIWMILASALEGLSADSNACVTVYASNRLLLPEQLAFRSNHTELSGEHSLQNTMAYLKWLYDLCYLNNTLISCQFRVVFPNIAGVQLYRKVPSLSIHRKCGKVQMLFLCSSSTVLCFVPSCSTLPSRSSVVIVPPT